MKYWIAPKLHCITENSLVIKDKVPGIYQLFFEALLSLIGMAQFVAHFMRHTGSRLNGDFVFCHPISPSMKCPSWNWRSISFPIWHVRAKWLANVAQVARFPQWYINVTVGMICFAFFKCQVFPLPYLANQWRKTQSKIAQCLSTL